MAARLRVTQVKSAIGYKKDQSITLRALGLGKMWRTVEKDDTPAIRGMLNKVRHLVRVEEATARPEPAPRPAEFSVLTAPVGPAAAAPEPATETDPEEAPAEQPVGTRGRSKALSADTEEAQAADDSETPEADAKSKPRRTRAKAAEAAEEGESSS